MRFGESKRGGGEEQGKGRGEVRGGSWRTKERQSVIEPLSRVLAWRKGCENDIMMIKVHDRTGKRKGEYSRVSSISRLPCS